MGLVGAKLQIPMLYIYIYIYVNKTKKKKKKMKNRYPSYPIVLRTQTWVSFLLLD